MDIAIDATRNWGVALALSMARPFALTLTSAAFLYAQINSGVIRATFAIALSLPVLSQAGPIFMIYQPLSGIDMAVIAAKEILLGLVIGIFLSVPVYAMGIAGSVIDAYRLESPAIPDPSNGQTTTHGKLFAILAVWTFASSGGFWIMSDVLYASYAIWPLNEFFVIKQQLAYSAMIDVLASITRISFTVAAPLLFLMFMSDFMFMIAARMFRRFQSYDFASTARSLILVFTIPAYLGVVSSINNSSTKELSNLVFLMKNAKENSR